MSKRVLFRRRLVVALVISLVGVVAYAVYALRIEDIRVTGLRTLDPKQIVEASGLNGDERILWIRLSSVTLRIERIPAVASVTVERSFLNTVVIRVVERTPIARLAGGLAVDAEGRLFASAAAGGLPVLEAPGPAGRPGSSADRVAKGVLDAFAVFPHGLRTRTARIIVGPPLTLVLKEGFEIRFGRHVDLLRKASVAEAVLAAEAGHRLAYIDVRSPSVPVSKPPTPAPTPVPTARPPAAPTPAPSTPGTAPTASPH